MPVVAVLHTLDVLAFADAYRQSAYYPDVCRDLTTRLSWVHRRAARR